MKQFFLFFFILTLGLAARTQTPVVDRSFNSADIGLGSGDGLDGFIKDAVVQADGKIIMGGHFFTYNGTTKPYLLRVNPSRQTPCAWVSPPWMKKR